MLTLILATPIFLSLTKLLALNYYSKMLFSTLI